MRKVKYRRGKHRLPQEDFSFQEADDRLYEIFRNHGLADFPHDKRHVLVNFYFLLMKHQKQYNLTRLVKLRDIAIKHFIDCLMVPQLAELRFPLLDMGTGPGFPGIPLKIMYPNDRIILNEPVQKKVEFLKIAREELHLQNLDIIARKVDKDFVYPVQGVITRAVEDLCENLDRVAAFLPAGAEVYFMKGPNVDDEIKKAEKTLGDIFQLKKDIAYQIHETPHQRRLVIFKKL